jgi:hypothetical protein
VMGRGGWHWLSDLTWLLNTALHISLSRPVPLAPHRKMQPVGLEFMAPQHHPDPSAFPPAASRW